MITAKPTNRLKTLFVLAVVMVVAGPALSETYTVTNTNDSGANSLRWAIESGNANPGSDIVAFDIPGPGPHTIQPLTALPLIENPVVIDGYYNEAAATLPPVPPGMWISATATDPDNNTSEFALSIEATRPGGGK